MSTSLYDLDCTLLELPFRDTDSPSLGLSLLKENILQSGRCCEIWYSNLLFEHQVGRSIYSTISRYLAQDLLVGEIVFAPLVWDQPVNADRLREIRSARTLNRGSCLPDWLLDGLPQLQNAAATFIDDLAERIVTRSPKLLGLSTTFYRLPSLALAKAVKAKKPHIHIVLGGANCDGEMGPATIRNFDFVDFVLQGEAEGSIVQLLSALDGFTSLADIKGLVQRHDREVLVNEPAPRIWQLDELPIPDYRDWFEQRNAMGLAANDNSISIPIETSRGCWFGEKSHCIFCGLNGETLTSRYKSAGRVIEELESLAEYEVMNLFATDLIFPHSYFKTALPSITGRGFDYSIYYETKSNLDRSCLVQMCDAGINRLQPGIESLDTATLKLMRKGVSAYQNIRLLKWCAELAINVFWNILIGTPGEKIDSLRRTQELIPALYHLRPPVDGCVWVRFDRFSPMFKGPEAFGVSSISPSPSYKIAYHLPEEEIDSLAYHFQADDDRLSDNYLENAKQLSVAVQHWHDRAGAASLIMLRHSSGIYVSDRRNGSENIRQLTPQEAAVLELSEAGIKRERLLSQLLVRKQGGNAESAIDGLLEKTILCNVDERLLALPTVFWPSELSNEAEIEEAFSLAHVVHCQRMRRLCEPYKVNLESMDA